jgi:hypothetical protein
MRDDPRLYRLSKIRLAFFIFAVLGFALIIWNSVQTQKRNCDYDSQVLTVDCLLKRNAEELKQMEQRDMEEYDGH